MDDAKKESYKLPAEWVDRIFLRLTEIYGVKFTGQWTKPDYMDMAKTLWRGGLYGLNSAEIKHALSICLNSLNTPPNAIEFFHTPNNTDSHRLRRSRQTVAIPRYRRNTWNKLGLN